jgi:hypothetical protein
MHIVFCGGLTVQRALICSKTGDSPCAYRAKFIEGKMQPDEPGKAAKPTPCAGNQGTTIRCVRIGVSSSRVCS